MKALSGVAPVLAVVAGLMFIGLSGSAGADDGGRPATTEVEHADSSGVGADGGDQADVPVGADKPATGQDQDDAPQVYGGNPVSTTADSRFVYLDNIGFDVGYSEMRRAPLWVGYRVSSKRLPGKHDRPETFSTDVRTSARVTHRDYTGSGYDRGHMAPNHAIVSRYGRDAQIETFMMSNIVPQTGTLNRGIWKDLEQLEADTWSGKFQEVWVITGPIYDEDAQYLHDRESGIEIPDSFYKIIVDETSIDSSMFRQDAGKGRSASGNGIRQWHRPRVLAFVIPQDVQGSETLEEFLVSVDWIEERTGLDMMPEIPDDVEDRLESEVADRLW